MTISSQANVAYLLDSYPSLSETFIYYQILGMQEQGVIPHLYPKVTPALDRVHEVIKRLDSVASTHPRAGYGIGHQLAVLLKSEGRKFVLNNRGQAPFQALLRDFLELEPLLNSKIDLLHVHYLSNAQRAIKLRRYGHYDGKILCSIHGYDVDDIEHLAQNPITDEFSEVDHITVATEFTRRSAIRLGCPPEKISVIPEPLDTGAFPYFDRKPDSLIVGSVGRLVEFKGFSDGIRAFARLHQRGFTDARYVIVGEGEERASLESLIAELSMQDHITLAGAKTQSEISEMMREWRLLLSPGVRAQNGREENQGVVIQEAQAAGVPVVVTRIGGAFEGLLPDTSGFIVESGNLDEMADRMEKLLTNFQLSQSMGEAGASHVRRVYDYRQTSTLYQPVYEQLLKGSTA